MVQVSWLSLECRPRQVSYTRTAILRIRTSKPPHGNHIKDTDEDGTYKETGDNKGEKGGNRPAASELSLVG